MKGTPEKFKCKEPGCSAEYNGARPDYFIPQHARWRWMTFHERTKHKGEA